MERRGPLGAVKAPSRATNRSETLMMFTSNSHAFLVFFRLPREKKSLIPHLPPRRPLDRQPAAASHPYHHHRTFFSPERCTCARGRLALPLPSRWARLVWEARAPVFIIAMGRMLPTLELVFSALHSVTVCVYPFFPPWRLVLRADHERLATRCRRFCSGRYTIACTFCVVHSVLPCQSRV